MAYVDFSEGALTPAPSCVMGAAPSPAPAAFSTLEWLVIRLAARDHLASLRQPGRVGRLVARIFGARAESRLASPRLEALRRIAVLAWHHGYNVPRSELATFRQAGFSSDQAEMLIDNVVGRRAAHRARRFA